MSDKGNIKGLAHIGIRVSDMDASINFYTQVLGFTLTHRQMNGQTELTFLEKGSCPLELICSPNVDVSALKPGQIDHIALEVTGIDALVDDLKAHGVHLLADSAATCPGILSGVKNIFFTGPDGERIEYFEYL